VLDGNPEGIESADDLAGKKVCTVSGSTSEKNVAEYTTDILATDTYSNCLEPLRTGAVSAVTTDNVILAGLADQNEGEFEVVGEPFTEEPYGIGLALDDTDFRMFVNDTLQDAEDDGTWDELWEKTAGKVLDTPTPPTIDRY
jgi:glutamate transport system substrate-binding protein